MKFAFKKMAVVVLAASAASVYAESSTPADQRFEIKTSSTALAAAKVVMEKRNVDMVYQMSSGRQMEVLSDGNALSVRYGRLGEATLRHDGQGNFVSQDRKMVMQFQLDRSGEAQQASLSIPAAWR